MWRFPREFEWKRFATLPIDGHKKPWTIYRLVWQPWTLQIDTETQPYFFRGVLFCEEKRDDRCLGSSRTMEPYVNGRPRFSTALTVRAMTCGNHSMMTLLSTTLSDYNHILLWWWKLVPKTQRENGRVARNVNLLISFTMVNVQAYIGIKIYTLPVKKSPQKNHHLRNLYF